MRAKQVKPINLTGRLRAYREKVADEAFRVMASQVGGTVTADVLQCIAKGGAQLLEPGEVRRIDKVLSRIDGSCNG